MKEFIIGFVKKDTEINRLEIQSFLKVHIHKDQPSSFENPHIKTRLSKIKENVSLVLKDTNDNLEKKNLEKLSNYISSHEEALLEEKELKGLKESALQSYQKFEENIKIFLQRVFFMKSKDEYDIDISFEQWFEEAGYTNRKNIGMYAVSAAKFYLDGDIRFTSMLLSHDMARIEQMVLMICHDMKEGRDFKKNKKELIQNLEALMETNAMYAAHIGGNPSFFEKARIEKITKEAKNPESIIGLDDSLWYDYRSKLIKHVKADLTDEQIDNLLKIIDAPTKIYPEKYDAIGEIYEYDYEEIRQYFLIPQHPKDQKEKNQKMKKELETIKVNLQKIKRFVKPGKEDEIKAEETLEELKDIEYEIENWCEEVKNTIGIIPALNSAWLQIAVFRHNFIGTLSSISALRMLIGRGGEITQERSTYGLQKIDVVIGAIGVIAELMDTNFSYNPWDHKTMKNEKQQFLEKAEIYEKREVQASGGKEKGLKELQLHQKSLGYKVPKFKTLQNGATDKEIKNIAEEFAGKDIMVRSNSKAEDGKLSFAGRYESVKVEDCDYEKLKKAYDEVQDSFHATKAVQYREKNNVDNDEMNVVVQEFINGDFYGVMNTSIPNYPIELSIEYSDEHAAITDGNRNAEIYSMDFSKGEDVMITFSSENHGSLRLEDEREEFCGKIANIGEKLEMLYGPSDVEFVIKDKQIYMVQKRDLHGVIKEIPHIDIPEYPADRILPKAEKARGVGIIKNLPIVSVQGMNNAIIGSAMNLMALPSSSLNDVKDGWINKVKELNEKYKDGYILVTNAFDETVHRGSDVTFDGLTTNKKALIVKELGGLTQSHALTVIKDQNIGYLGYSKYDKKSYMWDDVKTGDYGSIYFQGKDGHFFLEERPEEPWPTEVSSKKLKDVFGDSIRLAIDPETPSFSFEIQQNYTDTHDTFYEGFQKTLYDMTQKIWKYEEPNDSIGAIYTSPDGDSIEISGYRMGKTEWGISLSPRFTEEGAVYELPEGFLAQLKAILK